MQDNAEKYFNNWMENAFKEGRVEGAKTLPELYDCFYDKRTLSWYGRFIGGYFLQVSEKDLQ